MDREFLSRISLEKGAEYLVNFTSSTRKIWRVPALFLLAFNKTTWRSWDVPLLPGRPSIWRMGCPAALLLEEWIVSDTLGLICSLLICSDKNLWLFPMADVSQAWESWCGGCLWSYLAALIKGVMAPQQKGRDLGCWWSPSSSQGIGWPVRLEMCCLSLRSGNRGSRYLRISKELSVCLKNKGFKYLTGPVSMKLSAMPIKWNLSSSLPSLTFPHDSHGRQ